jgi:hypothetical protein
MHSGWRAGAEDRPKSPKSKTKSRRKRRHRYQSSSSNPKDPDPLFFKMLKVAQVYFTVLPLAFASAIFFAPKEFMAA